MVEYVFISLYNMLKSLIFVDSKKLNLDEQINAIYKLVHTVNKFSVSLQALMLLYQVCSTRYILALCVTCQHCVSSVTSVCNLSTLCGTCHQCVSAINMVCQLLEAAELFSKVTLSPFP